MSISMFPDQIDALRKLIDEIGAFAIDIAAGEAMSLRVVAFVRDESLEDDPVTARWFSVSVAGTVREVAPDPEPVAS